MKVIQHSIIFSFSQKLQRSKGVNSNKLDLLIRTFVYLIIIWI